MNATRAAGGIMTLQDMASYKPQIRPVVSTYYHGRKVVSCSTPTSGPLIIAALNILERFNLRLNGYTGLDLHRIIETLKHGFSFRTEFGDPDYISNDERIQEIMSKEWASRIRQNISDVSQKGISIGSCCSWCCCLRIPLIPHFIIIPDMIMSNHMVPCTCQ